MNANSETVYFNESSIYEIGGIQYQVFSYFDELGEDLQEKLKRLLKNEICQAK